MDPLSALLAESERDENPFAFVASAAYPPVPTSEPEPDPLSESLEEKEQVPVQVQAQPLQKEEKEEQKPSEDTTETSNVSSTYTQQADSAVPTVANVTVALTQVEKWASSVVFTISVRENNTGKERSIRREFEDLVWLRNELLRLHDTCLVPSLPPAPPADSTTASLQKHRFHIALFLARIAEHPILHSAEPTTVFLGPDIELPHKRSPAKKVEASTRALSSEAKEVDTKFDDLKKHYFNYDVALRDNIKALENVTKQRNAFAQFTFVAGENMHSLGNIEVDPLFASALRKWGKMWSANRDLIRSHAEHESESYNQITKLLQREIVSIKVLMDVRLQYLATSQRAARNARSKKEAADRMRADPKHRADRMVQAEADQAKAEEQEAETLRQYEAANIQVANELQRYERNKVLDFKVCLLAYAQNQINIEKQYLASFAALLPDVEAIPVEKN